VFREFEDCMNEVGEKRNELTETNEHGADHLSLGKELEWTWAQKAREENKPQIETDLFNWHLANLEFANADRLEVLSLGQWDQDDPYDFDGDHVWLPGGNVRLVSAMARELPIFYGHAVTNVEYQNKTEGRHDGVVVTCKNGREFRADAALVTVPLGVLKKGSVSFEPPLPERKTRAIGALGFGVLDKVILLFPKPFWDTSVDTFGYVAKGDRQRRGRYFMFYNYAKTDEHNLSGGAVLIALVSGEAALEFERDGHASAVEDTMQVLKDIYERQGVTIPDPIDSKCACWGSDEFAYGSYSNISVGATGEDYDALAEPVGDGLYFAGEATMRRHPATMHGAFLSGMREAARISERMREMNKAGKLRRG
jgi:lysine-specific histone demethylase 1